MATGGDITEITYNNPTVGKGSFFPVANQGNTFDPGGFRNADDANMISGDGQLVIQKNRVRAFFEVLCVNDMNLRNDAKILADLAASADQTVWTVSCVNETVWGGTGVPVGDINPDVNAATFSVKIAAGSFKKIVG